MSFPLINQYIIVNQITSDGHIKYSYCNTHIFYKFTNKDNNLLYRNSRHVNRKINSLLI